LFVVLDSKIYRREDVLKWRNFEGDLGREKSPRRERGMALKGVYIT